MEKKIPNDSVHDEQFSNEEKNAETSNETPANEGDKENTEENRINEEHPDEKNISEVERESEVEKKEEVDEKKEDETNVEVEKKSDVEGKPEPVSDHENQDEHQNIDDKKKTSERKEDNAPTMVDYTLLSKEELVARLGDLLSNYNITLIKEHVDLIKSNFYKKHKADLEKIKKSFLEQGGNLEDFKPEPDIQEQNLKAYLKDHQDKKSEYNRKLEDEKQSNLEEKYRIINEIKELVNRDESLNKTFQEFRDLQKQWREVGIVPQQNLKDLWESYHHNVEKFYDYIKINKELRDLDLKKNLEKKIGLCEKAEELLLEPNIVDAFKRLQKFHDNWREIGPVPRENRAETWQRFKEATSKINKKHQEFFINLKKEQKKNLEAKRTLCEKADEIEARINEFQNFPDWNEASKELIELQKVWRTIGFAPKKDNNKIYDRFRSTCDAFFNAKREFFSEAKEEQQNNLQRKEDICIQAESLKDSSEWKKTTEDLIALQKQWKKIGPVPRKHTEPIWKRFRAACDQFFNRKEEFYSNIDSKYEENLNKKEELIKEIEAFALSGSPKESFNKLKDFQRRYAEIGFVPIKKKDEIQHKYRDAINRKFDNLKINDNEKSILKFKAKLEDLNVKPKGSQRMLQDRDKFVSKLKQLESDITLWENNIGFFAKSKTANSMIQEVEQKIENAKKKIQTLKEKINLIDKQLDEEE